MRVYSLKRVLLPEKLENKGICSFTIVSIEFDLYLNNAVSDDSMGRNLQRHTAVIEQTAVLLHRHLWVDKTETSHLGCINYEPNGTKQGGTYLNCSSKKLSFCCKTLSIVREHPPEMEKNEWEVIGTGQTIYTVSNTTQFGVVSFKVDCKCHIADARCNTLKIQPVASALHRGFSYCQWKCTAVLVNIQKQHFEKVKNNSKTYHPLKKVLSGLFFKIHSIFVSITHV